eukprot:sb/3464190/
MLHFDHHQFPITIPPISGGDPTGTGQGGESIYGSDFPDEVHQRLKFIRRGLVAMANSGTPDSNGSQFFITLGECSELQKKHTIFGKVSGNTIFNVLRMAELETDSNERPLEPPSIRKTEVLNNPFDDIEPRESRHLKTLDSHDILSLYCRTQQPVSKELSRLTLSAEKKKEKKKSQMKATKNYKLLSFGDEAEEDEEETEQVSTKIGKISSAHDKLSDPKLSKEIAVTKKQLEEDRTSMKTQAEKIREKLKKELEVKPVEEVTTARDAKIASLKSESEKLMEEIKGIGREEKGEQGSGVDKDANLNADEKVTVNQFRRDLKEFKEKNGETKAKTKSEREKRTMCALKDFTSKLKSAAKKRFDHCNSCAVRNKNRDAGTTPVELLPGDLTHFPLPTQDADNASVELLPEDLTAEDEEDMLNSVNLFSHSLVGEDSKAKVKDANVVDDDTYEIFDPRHPINKRKRGDKSKGGKKKEGGSDDKWKRTKILT